jgi:hypothetical protein
MNDLEGRMWNCLTIIKSEQDYRSEAAEEIKKLEEKVEALKYVRAESLKKEIELRQNLKEMASQYADDFAW